MPSCPGGNGHAADHLDLQRLLLGDHADLDGRQAARDVGAGQPAGTVRLQPEPDRRGRDDRSRTHPGRVPSATASVHRWPHPRIDEGLTMADQEATGPAMLPAQRQDRILAEIERVGGARIAQLAELLGVSEMTVRRDIDALARQSLIKKVYGGATAPARSTSDEPGFEAKSHRELAAKDQIGAMAASLIEPRTTVAVSAGTTTYATAVHLAKIPGLPVVTNS